MYAASAGLVLLMSPLGSCRASDGRADKRLPGFPSTRRPNSCQPAADTTGRGTQSKTACTCWVPAPVTLSLWHDSLYLLALNSRSDPSPTLSFTSNCLPSVQITSLSHPRSIFRLLFSLILCLRLLLFRWLEPLVLASSFFFRLVGCAHPPKGAEAGRKSPFVRISIAWASSGSQTSRSIGNRNHVEYIS